MAILTVDQAYTNDNGIQRPLIDTNGWDVQFKCRGQITDWVHLHLIKKSNPIEVQNMIWPTVTPMNQLLDCGCVKC